MGVLLGLAAAALYGTTDFAGGLLSRRSGSPHAVVVAGSLASASLVWALLAVVGGQAPGPRVIGYGLAAGVASGIGTIALYRGLARGRMSVVGPVSAVGAAVLPVVVGVATGERPNPVALLGVLAALPAIALVAGAGTSDDAAPTDDGGGRCGKIGKRTSGLADGLIAGAAFGVMFVALARTGGRTGLWPLAFEQTGALAMVLAVAVITRASLRQSLRDGAASALNGVGGLVATLLYYLATHAGMLSTVAVLTSLYPGVTVLLAFLIMRERISPAQRTGLGLCALAVVAIATG
jgi:drug/metabolite transporter (DMT)-like permease